MADEEKKDAEGGEDKPKSKKKLIIIIAAAVVVLGGGAGAFLMMSGGDENAEGEHGDAHVQEIEEEAHLATAELEPFIVNLSEQTSFLKIKVLIEYDPELLNMGHDHGGGGAYGGGGSGGGGGGEGAGGGLPSVMAEREPMIRDAVIRVIASKTAKQVLSTEGKEELKEELLDAINEAIGLDEPAVVNLYFIEFIIQ
ncbi:MAG: flagellar basal body-associated FliL family protein [Bdellovibrionales bacterium]|nr:flagellar basal body-associated FliL family protein [Bdellovibrionales bacterium]